MAESTFNIETTTIVERSAYNVPRSVLEHTAPPPRNDMTDAEYLAWLDELDDLIDDLPHRYINGPHPNGGTVDGWINEGSDD